MGFSIGSDGLVSIDHQINHFAFTTMQGGKSPCIAKSKCDNFPIKIYSAYYRPKGPRNSKEEGDNCPFIYAWKKKSQKLYMTRDSLRNMREDFYLILDELVDRLSQENQIDFIIPLPSKHCLAKSFSVRLRRRIAGSTLLDNVFVKKSNNEILEEIYDLRINHADKTKLINAISIANALNRGFSISDVPTQLRGYLDPIKINTSVMHDGTYLLVDDLFASGATLLNAKDKILEINSNINVLGSFMFSPYNNRIR